MNGCQGQGLGPFDCHTPRRGDQAASRRTRAGPGTRAVPQAAAETETLVMPRALVGHGPRWSGQCLSLHLHSHQRPAERFGTRACPCRAKNGVMPRVPRTCLRRASVEAGCGSHRQKASGMQSRRPGGERDERERSPEYRGRGGGYCTRPDHTVKRHGEVPAPTRKPRPRQGSTASRVV